MNPDEFKQELEKKNILLSLNQMEQFKKYFLLLNEWNEKINLTAIKEKNEVYLKHFYDSISPSFFIDLFKQKDIKLCDVGSGAGFPSIPLKIIFPDLEITIIDSLNKRIIFLQELVNQLELKKVFLCHDRAETLGQNEKYRGQFDIVTARAVARLNILSELCIPLIKKDGLFLAMKATKIVEELNEAERAINLLGGEIMTTYSLSLPIELDERNIIVIKKKKNTPQKYPRKPGLPNKSPLI